VRERVTRSRELVAAGFAVAAVASVLQVSRQALYRVPTRRRLGPADNRMRGHRVRRQATLIERPTPLERRKRPCFFRVERPRQLCSST
jgi:hypothetical protein